MATKSNLRVTVNFTKNYVFQLSHGIKNLYEASCTKASTLEETFFAVATFEGLWVVFLSDRSTKLAIYFSQFQSSLAFRRTEDQINTVCNKLIVITSITSIVSLLCQRVNLPWKMAVQDVSNVFAYFCGGHKSNFRL